MTTADRLTLIVDWSAASSPGPARPTKDRCWTAASGDVAPRYHRTRAACVAYLLETLRAHSGPALLGFDFPLAHPSFQGEPVLPAGRDLAEMLAVRITDSGDDSNNRFEVAAAINHEICDRFGLDHGPFWGFVGPSGVRPPAGLTATRPACPIPEFRACELELIERGLRPQSAWKLAYPASVGSQTLTGM
ncbi:MAG: molybdopterin molybdenumtransferase MoeA, partial [Planctomycetota bacterium]